MNAEPLSPPAASAADAGRRLGTFLLLTALFSGGILLLALTGRVTTIAGLSPTLFLMWCPGIAAGLTQLLTARSLRGLGWRPASSPTSTASTWTTGAL